MIDDPPAPISPIKSSSGLTLQPSELAGIAAVEVTDGRHINDLPWDRYRRLAKSAQALIELLDQLKLADQPRILDVGGFDGALAFFVQPYKINLLDPLTTGGCGTDIAAPDRAFDLVVSIDALEHIPPEQRQKFIAELCRVSRHGIVLNYPQALTSQAQALVHKLTGNPYIAEHVEYALPKTESVVGWLAEERFHATVQHHTSVAVWVSHFCLSHLSPVAGHEVGRYLLDNQEGEQGALYELLTAQRH